MTKGKNERRKKNAKVVGEMAIYRQPFSDGCNLLDSNSLSHWGPEAWKASHFAPIVVHPRWALDSAPPMVALFPLTMVSSPFFETQPRIVQ